LRAEARLREILEELLAALNSPDPFSVDLPRVLKELAELLPSLSEYGLEMDAEALYYVAELIARQEEWVKGRSALLVLGPFVAMLKVLALSTKELAQELLKAWNPIVELEQVTFADILRGLEYLEERGKPLPLPEAALPLSYAGFELLEELGLVAGPELEEAVGEVRELLRGEFERRGYALYREVVACDSLRKTYLRAYAISHLATSGEVSIAMDPVSGEVYVTPPGEGEVVSIAIPLSELSEKAAQQRTRVEQ